MTKLLTIAKDQLHVAGGYLLDAEDNIIAVPNQHKIIHQFNKLLHDLELAAYVQDQPDYCPAPTTAGFGAKEKYVFAEPEDWAKDILDARKKEASDLDAALKEVAEAQKIDKQMHDIVELVHFCETEEFTVPDNYAGIPGWDERILLMDGCFIMEAFIHINEQKERTMQGPKNDGPSYICKKQLVEL